MQPRKSLRLLLLLVLLAPAQLAMQLDSEWEQVVPGIEYRHYTLPGPNQVFVARMDRDQPDIILDTTIARGIFGQGTETVRDMVARFDQSISAWDGQWGARNDVIVAINGSFHNVNSGIPETGMVQSGWYAKRFDDLGGTSGFAWTRDRSAFVGGCAYHPEERQRITLLDARVTLNIEAINFRRSYHNVTLYTPQHGARTPGRSGSVELLIEMTEPAGIVPLPRSILGYIRQVNTGGHTLIPYDHVVLSAGGEAGDTLLRHAHVGDRVGISAEISNMESDCDTPRPGDWSLTYATLGGSFHFLRDREIQEFDDLGAINRAPRTAICFNDDYIHFVVVDGRQSGYSIGMNMDELGAFCRDVLESDEGLNQDGGGSSTFWLNGEVVNRPSDGQERPVANGWVMVRLEPMERSDAFLPGEPVTVSQLADLRLGPGRNFRSYADLQEGDTGSVIHPMNGLEGVLAQGIYWWKVSVDGLEGWVDEAALASDPDWQALWRWHP